MAMNPMQRKIRNSFLFGFLVAIIVAALLIGLLFIKIKGLNDEIQDMREKQNIAMTDVYTVTQAVKAGESVRYLSTISVATEKVPENAITDENLDNYAETNAKGELILDANGNTSYQMLAKVGITPNTIMTTDMVEKSSEAGTFRLVEYNMITLPSKLETGDYIDIRLADSTAVDCIVISKIKVEEATTNSIWLKVSESQLLTLNNAIIESYIMSGTKLYATQFTNEAQAALNTTYVPNENVRKLIATNKLTDEDQELLDKAEVDSMGIGAYIAGIIAGYEEERVDKVEEGFTSEKTAIQAAREELLGEVGY